MEAVSKSRSKIVVDMRSIVKTGEKQDRLTAATPVEVMQLNAIDGDKAGFRRERRSRYLSTTDAERQQENSNKARSAMSHRPNDPSSATRPAGRVDCNRSAMAGFAAAHG